MEVLSLFDGISCGMLALQRAGIEVGRYVAYEIDKYAIKISKSNYHQIEHCGDVTTADFTQYTGFDLLIGGSPCQSLSIVQSKTRLNLDGKSKLFFEYVRAKEEMQPKFFLFENVASMNDESKKIISDLLGCEQGCSLVLKDIMQANVEEKYFYDYPLTNIDMSKQVCAIMEFKNHQMHKRIFNPNFKCHTLTTCGGGNTQKKVLDGGRARKLTPLEYERLQTLPDNYTNCVADGHRYSAIGNGWTVNVITHILKGLKAVK